MPRVAGPHCQCFDPLRKRVIATRLAVQQEQLIPRILAIILSMGQKRRCQHDK